MGGRSFQISHQIFDLSLICAMNSTFSPSKQAYRFGFQNWTTYLNSFICSLISNTASNKRYHKFNNFSVKLVKFIWIEKLSNVANLAPYNPNFIMKVAGRPIWLGKSSPNELFYACKDWILFRVHFVAGYTWSRSSSFRITVTIVSQFLF